MKSNNFSILLILAAGLLLTACGSTAEAKEPAATPAAVADSGVISAEGHIVPRDKVFLTFASGGHVNKILIKKGEQVRSGQILADLDTTALEQIAVDQAQRHLLEMTSPASIAAAEQAVAAARDALDKAQDKADSLFYPRASESLVDHTQGEIDLAKHQLTRTTDRYRQLARLDNDNEQKAAALVAMTNAQLNLNQLVAQYNWYAGKPDEIDAAIIQSNLDAAKANLQEAEWYLETLKGAQVPSNATGGQLVRLEQARDDLAMAQVRLAGTRLVAPFSGTITDLNITSGQFVGPETPALQVADFSQWFIETSDLTEIEVVDISEHQAVIVSVESLPNVELKGTVDSIDKNFSERQGDIVYRVRVLLSDPDPAIRWGMTGEVRFQR
jgi:multidrug efflux pump subunit AcrA (membrane-fusion protein)